MKGALFFAAALLLALVVGLTARVIITFTGEPDPFAEQDQAERESAAEWLGIGGAAFVEHVKLNRTTGDRNHA